MTATDELRRLLDERGVEYDGKTYEGVTFWNDDTNMAVASEGYDGKLWVSQSLTPKQAIEATLGRGECELPTTYLDHGHIEYNGVTEWRKCSGCGREILAYPANYCPNCGRKVVDA